MSNSKMKRHRYEAKEKVTVLKRHLLKKELVSDIKAEKKVLSEKLYARSSMQNTTL